MKKKLAIFAPNQNAYSETFIQAHRKLPFDIKYYYGGFLPTKLEGTDDLYNFSLKQRIEKKIFRRFSLQQYALLYSLQKEKPDAILAEYGITACETLAVVRYLQIPMIVHFHGFDASVKEVLEKYKTAYTEVFAYAYQVIVVSAAMEKALQQMGCPPGKITIATYGPDDRFFDIRPAYNSHFIAVGRFVEKKAPHLSVLAFSKVVQQFPGATLTIVGEGPLLPDCQELAKTLGIENNISFPGVQTPAQVTTLFENSLAFIQHSIVAGNGDSEGTPVAILEAQAASLPVIATRHAGIPDVVIPGETGLLCDEKDTAAMSAHMLQLLSGRDTARTMGEKGKVRVLQYFTMEKNLQQLETIIFQAMHTS